VVVDGEVRHVAGVTAVPGLYFIGLPWQTCRGSALLGFVGADAAALAAQLTSAAGTTDVSARGPEASAVSPA
jgi:putative flavoprotein involved in K+ transport